jgi:class 3 adenylate cyclase/ActR/RegA family two-component response regulator
VRGEISVVLADDSVIVREGVRALLESSGDIRVVGLAGDGQELMRVADCTLPQVIVTDIRMPPTLQREGIEAAAAIRRRHPGTGVVVLSQYDEPEYAISLLEDGASGCAYLLKDRIGEGDQLARAVRAVATGGSMLDPKIVDELVQPLAGHEGIAVSDTELLHLIAQGRPIKAIAAARNTTPAAVATDIEQVFLKLASAAQDGASGALRRLRELHEGIVRREEEGQVLSRMLPEGVADLVRTEGARSRVSTRMTVTILMSDIRGYSGIAEHTDPTVLAGLLNEHRSRMTEAVTAQAGTVMQFVGDAVMAVFGAPLPLPGHADRALAAAFAMQQAQQEINLGWFAEGLPGFQLGIGLSTGEVAAALLGSDEHLEYTVVGDTVNLSQRLQQWAAGGEIILSEPTWESLASPVAAEALPPQAVKGRIASVAAYRVPASTVSSTLPAHDLHEKA